MLLMNTTTYASMEKKEKYQDIGLDKSEYQVNKFLISQWKHIVGTHLKHLNEALLMSTHNICFCWEVSGERMCTLLVNRLED